MSSRPLRVALVLIAVALACSSSGTRPQGGGGGSGGDGDTGGKAGPQTGGAGGSQTGGRGGSATGGAGDAGRGGAGTGGSGGAEAPDAGPGAGGMGGQGMAGAGGSPATAGCPTGASCFDFEKDTAGGPPGAPWMPGMAGKIAVETAKAWSGKQAVHITAPTSRTEGAFITLTEGFPKPSNEYFGRLMMWAETIPGGNAHWTFVQSDGQVAGKNFKAFYTYGAEGSKIIANYDSDPAKSDCWKFGGTVPVKKWVCMEWHFKGTATGGELELWVDGRLLYQEGPDIP